VDLMTTAHGAAKQLPVSRLVALLISLLASGFLTSYVLFGSHAAPAPTPTPAVAPEPQPDAAAPNIPPIKPQDRARARAAVLIPPLHPAK
jgi:hypothetical protein